MFKRWSLIWGILWTQLCTPPHSYGLPRWLSGKESACNAGDMGLIPGSGRSPGEGNGNPLQHSCQKIPKDRRAWWATVRGGHRKVRHDLASKLQRLIYMLKPWPLNVMVFGNGAFGRSLDLDEMGWGPCDGVSGFTRRKKGQSFPTMWGHSEETIVCKSGRGFSPGIGQHFDLGLLSLQRS